MRLSSMARQRVLTLLALTSLVAIMVTITRFSSLGEPTNVRLMISQQKLIEYQKSLRLIASENNSNQTFNNLLETLIQTKSDNTLPVLRDQDMLRQEPVVAAQPSSSPQTNNLDSLVPIKESAVIDPIPLKVGAISGSKAPVPVTGKPAQDKTGQSGIAPKASQKNNKVDKKVVNRTAKAVKSNDMKSDTQPVPKVDIGVDTDQKSVQSNQKLQQLDTIENSVDSKIRAENKEKLKPKLVFDENDLKTTESMLIDKPLGCDDDLGAALDLLVIVNSAVDHFEARTAIRDTWGRFAVERGASLFFLIGSTTNQTVQDLVLKEDKEYEDILQGRYIDNYFNLTLKTISMMRWLSDRCYKVKYVLKVDDDMFVNMQHITDFSETRYFNKCIIGKLAKKWKPHRDPRNKWYVPSDAFNGTLFPSFATGPAYMLSGDAVKPLYEWSIKLKPIYLEDVYMTGIVAERAHIRRLNHAMMTNIHIKNINSCNYSKFMTSHKHSPQEIELLWRLVYIQKKCPPPPTRPPKAIKPTKGVAKGTATKPTKSRPVQNAG